MGGLIPDLLVRPTRALAPSRPRALAPSLASSDARSAAPHFDYRSPHDAQGRPGSSRASAERSKRSGEGRRKAEWAK